MKQVILGEDTETGRALRLDLDMLVRTRLLIQANSGGGKSWTIRRLLEQSHGRVQQIVLDPEGEFATLREKYDYVLVGKGGDVATDARHAPKLAERLMELGASAIIDLYELKPADRRHYVAVFLSALVNLPKHLWHPCLVVVDEAHVYCMDEETEILTPIGWKRWDGVKPGDLAVAFDLETGGFRNEPVLRVITKRHTGEMVRLRSDGIDSLVTSDHRVVLHRIQRGVGRYGIYLPVFCRASDIPTHVYIPIGGAPVGPGVEGLTLDMARIVGWVISDGYRSATKKDGRGMVEELRVLLPAGVATYPRERRNRSQSVVFYFGADFSRDVLRWLEDGLHRIPRRILADGSPAQLRALYFGLLEGDGTATVGGWRAFYPGKDEALADDFQELATRLGISAVKKYVPQTGQWTVLLSHRKRHYIRRPERQAYEGLVWDITIPSGAFVARRHGKVFVTGNCPERGVGESESLDAVIDLTTRGRKRGYASVLATQRISKLHKDAAAECRNRLIGLSVIDVDRERAAEELGWHRNKEAALRLRDLEQGEFYAFGPALVKAVTKVRIGSVQTSHPEIGARTAPPPPPREKVVAILGKLADLPKEAAEEEAEIVRLRRQVAETRAELARRPTVQIPEPVQVEIPAIDEVAMRRLESVAVTFREGVDGLREFARTLYERADQTKAAVERLLDSVVRFRQNGARRQELVRPRHTTPPEPQRIRVNRPFKAEEFPDMRQGRLGKGELKILRAIAQHYDEGATREQLTVLTGYKRSSRDTYLQRLRAWALVTDEGGRIQVTDAGIAALGPQFEPLPTGDALRVHWMERLPEGERKVLGVLVEAWPAAVDRETITEAIGYQRSSRDTYLQRLRSRRLVTVEARGQVRAADMLFDTAPVRAR